MLYIEPWKWADNLVGQAARFYIEPWKWADNLVGQAASALY